MSGNKGFALLAGINRPIIPNHVTKMATSLERMGVKRPVIVSTIDFIVGSPVTYIIDGQHLYHALMRMGWDVPYTEVEIKDSVDLAEHLALLNNSSKSWSIHDYITVWANVNKDYVKLNQYFNIYDIELSQIADILMNGSCNGYIGGSHNASTSIKKGGFKIEDEEKAVFLLNCITDALKIVPRMDRLSNRFFISCYINFISGYDHAHFLVNLKLNKDKFKMVTQDPEQYNKLLKQIMK